MTASEIRLPSSSAVKTNSNVDVAASAVFRLRNVTPRLSAVLSIVRDRAWSIVHYSSSSALTALPQTGETQSGRSGIGWRGWRWLFLPCS